MTKDEAKVKARETFNEAWRRAGPIAGLSGIVVHDRFVNAHIDAIADALIKVSENTGNEKDEKDEDSNGAAPDEKPSV
jgi:hypothetical protein